ncbi:permease [Dactylosporangium sp. NPDC000244]|uniref:permease n=1 Tax=Dactylosporangium sp. NPDC000244 TaxID=3154365 RepID=UPI00331E5B93
MRAKVRPYGLELLAVGLIGAIALRGRVGGAFGSPRAQEWVTVFVAIVVQAMPFVVLGTLLSAAIAVLVPERFFARALPARPALAVPVAGIAGLALPGCECASVPVAGALMRRGVTPAAALAFLLAAPAINPVVLAATAVAFPGEPMMVVARLVASLATSVAMGWLWLRLGRGDWLRTPHREPVSGSRAVAYFATVRQDAADAAGFLVLGAAAAACLNVLVPQQWLHVLAGRAVLAVVALAGLAVLLSICSEADAFVAASLSQFSLTARLAFLVVGPMVDLKLFAMQVGAFGRRFAIRFAPATFAVGVTLAVATAGALL